MQADKTFFESKKARVYYNNEHDTLFLEYLGQVKDHNEFLEINSALLAAFKSLDTQKVVADIRKMGIISVESQQYVVKTLFPGMIEHLNGKKLFHAQFMDPGEIFAKVSAQNIKNKGANAEQGFVVNQFTDMDELKKWLDSV